MFVRAVNDCSTRVHHSERVREVKVCDAIDVKG